MSRHSSFAVTGEISEHGGAVVPLFRLRAVEWDLPLTEADGRLVLILWGARVSLAVELGVARLEINAPDERMLRTVQESLTELAEANSLTLRWSRVAEGALAPGLSIFEVVSVEPRGAHFLRVTLRGTEASRFAAGGLHFRLLLPPAGRSAVWPRISASGRTLWPEGPDALHRAVYTTAAQSADWLAFDIFRHPHSPTCDWARTACAGQEVGLMGPGGGGVPQENRILAFGDETALPAIARILAQAPGEVRAVLRADAADLGDLAGDPRLRTVQDLGAALAATDIPDDAFVWFAACAEEARLARSALLARGLGKKRFQATAYWS